MNDTIRFTKREIEVLPPAESGKRDYYADIRGGSLRLMVTDRGAKSWVMQRRIAGRAKRFTLGRFPDMTPENARLAVEKTVGKLAEGRDPQAEKVEARAKQVTLREAFDHFVKVRKLKPSTLKTYRQIVESPLRDWLQRPMIAITKDAVAERHAKLSRENGGPYADSTMRTLRSVWNFAMAQYENGAGESVLPANPVERISKTKAWHRTKRRRTFISTDHLPLWFGAVQTLRADPDSEFSRCVGDYLLTIALTGLRKTEAASLTWTNVDLNARTLTISDTAAKNHDKHVVPLPVYLHGVLSARYQIRGTNAFVFAGDIPGTYLKEPRQQMLRVDLESSTHYTLHDLRRTFSTVAESLDLSHYSLKRLLNHRISGDVTAGYIGLNIDRLRDPMQKIEDYMLKAGRVIARTPVKQLSAARKRKGSTNE